jgi:hypothetical protein
MVFEQQGEYASEWEAIGSIATPATPNLIRAVG